MSAILLSDILNEISGFKFCFVCFRGCCNALFF